MTVMQCNDEGGEMRPVILHSSQTDDRRRHGMLDLLILSAELDVATEISRQELESVKCLELDQRQARVNVSSSRKMWH